jgi:hypothetical protein
MADAFVHGAVDDPRLVPVPGWVDIRIGDASDDPSTIDEETVRAGVRFAISIGPTGRSIKARCLEFADVVEFGDQSRALQLVSRIIVDVGQQDDVEESRAVVVR